MWQMILMAMVTLLTTVGCGGPRYIDYFPYHDDGMPKPRVALLPITDSSKSGLPWDVSEELSQGLYYSLMDSGELYVLTPEEIGQGWQQKDSIDFFGNDLSFTTQFCNTDFIVVMDLFDHSVHACDSEQLGKHDSPACHSYNKALTMSVRMRVIDVRRQQPRIAAYEVVKADYIVAPPYDKVNYGALQWGTEGYLSTPCFTVHQRLIKNLTLRLEDVLLCVR